jgi:SAM-dependent methyltransferase
LAFDNRAFWIKVGGDYLRHYPAEAYKDIDKAFVNVMKKELDINKIENVLEIGCGFGRISKVMIELLPSLKNYEAIDLSKEMIEQWKSYCKLRESEGAFIAYVADFEDKEERFGLYDLVLSVEVMTSIPSGIQGEYRVKKFIDRMIDHSKKYVVNQDWFNAPNRQEQLESKRKQMKSFYDINQYHDYDLHYSNNPKVLQIIGHSIPHYSEHIFVGRLK